MPYQQPNFISKQEIFEYTVKMILDFYDQMEDMKISPYKTSVLVKVENIQESLESNANHYKYTKCKL